MDDLKKTGKPDRIRINVNQRFERLDWCRALGVSQIELRAAVKAVGPMVKDVKKYLIEKFTERVNNA